MKGKNIIMGVVTFTPALSAVGGTEPGPDPWSIQVQYYAAEYCCKFNRRKLGNSAHLRILAALVQ